MLRNCSSILFFGLPLKSTYCAPDVALARGTGHDGAWGNACFSLSVVHGTGSFLLGTVFCAEYNKHRYDTVKSVDRIEREFVKQ